MIVYLKLILLFYHSISLSTFLILLWIIDITIKIQLIIQVKISGIWNILDKNIINAKAHIAQNAQCSRYLNSDNVFCSTNIKVKDLTNIAQIQSHRAMITMFFESANAQITPSKEKLASRISRYKKLQNHHENSFIVLLSQSCKNELIDEIIKNVL